jgi:signal transduction histidine kinase
VGPFLRQALDGAALPVGIEASIECPSSLPHAVGDADQLHIVLGNLLRNARDAMPDGGQLIVRAAAAEGYVEISVTDTGHGIDPDNLQRIMQPLFSTKARGMGLGLAMARAIVEKCEGTISVASVPEEGATFIVRLRAGPGLEQ